MRDVRIESISATVEFSRQSPIQVIEHRRGTGRSRAVWARDAYGASELSRSAVRRDEMTSL